jgi:hypothetical protein
MINVGLSRKIGLANFGSAGATCNVQFEADHQLLQDDLQGFHQKVRNAFVACRQAVQDELARQKNAESPSGNMPGGQTGDESPKQPGVNGSGCRNGKSGSQSNGQNGSHAASEKQMLYLRQLAKQVPSLGVRRLENLAQKMYGKPLVLLTSLDCSGLIDTLKSIKAGEIDLDRVLEGNAA